MIRIFRVYLPAGLFALLVSEIVLTSLCFLFAAYLVLTEDLSTYLLYDDGLIRLFIVVASIIFGFYLMDLYSDVHVKSRLRLLQHLCQVFGIALIVQGVISYVSPNLRFGRGIMLVGGLLSLVVLFGWRLVCSASISKVVGAERIVLVGWTPTVQQIAAHMTRHPELGLAVQGCLEDSAAPEAIQPVKYLGPTRQLRRVAEELRPSRIIVDSANSSERLLAEDLIELRFAGFTVQDAASAHETVFGRLCAEELTPNQLIFAKAGEMGWRPSRLLFHETISVIAGLSFTILALPFIFLIAILVKLSSKGPVLTRELYIGKNGREFVVNRFRSTTTDSLEQSNPTPFGAWLCRLRLDALPLVFNLLRGEMSLVGPLPERPESVDALSRRIPYYCQRLSVKPGITGWAQLNMGRESALRDVITALEYDLYYIKNISLSLNAYIVIHSLKSLLLARAS